MTGTIAVGASETKPVAAPLAANRALSGPRVSGRVVVMTLYLLFLMLPLYWMVNMSLRPNADILANFSLWPTSPTLANYAKIFTDPAWFGAYLNSII